MRCCTTDQVYMYPSALTDNDLYWYNILQRPLMYAIIGFISDRPHHCSLWRY